MIERKKRQMKVRALKLQECDVQALSLVDRGAIRAPFKRFKSEHQTPREDKTVGFNLTQLLKSEQPLELAAIVLAPEVDREKGAEALKAAGYSVEEPQEIDGCTVFVQEDAELDDHVIKIKASDQIGVVLTGDLKLGGLASAFNDLPALPGTLALAGEILDGLPREKQEGALAEVTSYLKQLPPDTYKLSRIKIEVVAPEPPKPEEPKPEEPKPEETEKAKAEAPTLESILAGVKGLLDERDAKLNTRIDEITKSVETVKSDTTSALRKIVPGYVGDEDPEPREKQETDPFSHGGFDTGLETLAAGSL